VHSGWFADLKTQKLNPRTSRVSGCFHLSPGIPQILDRVCAKSGFLLFSRSFPSKTINPAQKISGGRKRFTKGFDCGLLSSGRAAFQNRSIERFGRSAEFHVPLVRTSQELAHQGYGFREEPETAPPVSESPHSQSLAAANSLSLPPTSPVPSLPRPRRAIGTASTIAALAAATQTPSTSSPTAPHR